MAAIQRGPDARHELTAADVLRDVRTFEERLADYAGDPMFAIPVLLGIAGVSFAYPALADVGIVFFGLAFWFCAAQQAKRGMPLRVPAESNRLDQNDIDPGTMKPRQAAGTYYIGNELKGRRELWVSNDDVRRHLLIFGTTGAGKTEFLISLCANFLVQGSGFLLVDGKADTKLYAQVYSMARMFGREMDVRVVNFMSGGKDIRGPQATKFSNTLNPFSAGSSSMITNLIVSLISKSGEGGGGDMWQGRAIAFVEALIKPLVYLRDEYGIQLDANLILEFFELSKLEILVYDLPRTYPGLDEMCVAMKTFTTTLSAYDPDKRGRLTDPALLPEFIAKLRAGELDTEKLAAKKRENAARAQAAAGAAGRGQRRPPQQDDDGGVKLTEQADVTREQFGYVTMQLTRVFTSLAFTYGHLLKHPLPEVDMHDIVLNRRLLVVLLPALEKSLPELANLGKLIVGAVKQLMASALGAELEGRWKDIVETKPSNSNTSFFACFDEYGAYAVEGFFVAPAQARGLAISCCFSGQDVPGFARAGEKEAKSIFGNCGLKFFGKIEDAAETLKLATESASEMWAAQIQGYEFEAGGLQEYTNQKNSGIQRINRINASDVRAQIEGQYHIVHKDKVVRAATYFAAPKPVAHVRVNHFIAIKPPSSSAIKEFTRAGNTISTLLHTTSLNLTDDEIIGEQLPQGDVLPSAIRSQSTLNAYDAAAAALATAQQSLDDVETAAYHGVGAAGDDDELPATQARPPVTSPHPRPTQTNLFVRPQPLSVAGGSPQPLSTDNFQLDQDALASGLEQVEKTMGASAEDARRVAERFAETVKMKTTYPTRRPTQITDDAYKGLISNMSALMNQDAPQQPD